MAMEKFHHTLTYENEEGEEKKLKLILPKFDQLPFGLVRRHRHLPEYEQFFTLLEELLTEEELIKLDMVGQRAVLDLMKAWQQDAGITVGESSGS